MKLKKGLYCRDNYNFVITGKFFLSNQKSFEGLIM